MAEEKGEGPEDVDTIGVNICTLHNLANITILNVEIPTCYQMSTFLVYTPNILILFHFNDTKNNL